MNASSPALLRAATVLAALPLFAVGVANLAGVPALHHSFAELGLPVAFGYFIGACEVAGAVALFLPRWSSLAAAGLVVIMIGALYYHVVAGHAMQGLPALLILLLCVYVGVRQRARSPLLQRAA